MIDSSRIAGSLARAGIERLPPPARTYLSDRLSRQFAEMGDAGDYEHNLGNLGNWTFGKAKTKKQLQKELAEEKKKLAKEKAKLKAEKDKEARERMAQQQRLQQQQMQSQQAMMQQQMADQQQIMQAQNESAMAQQQAQFAQQQAEQASMAQQSAMQQPMTQATMDPGAFGQQMAPAPVTVDYEVEEGPPIEGADEPVSPDRFASFPDMDSAARALVATSYRAAPRDWSQVTAAQLSGLATYPITSIRALGSADPVPAGMFALPVRSGGVLHVPEADAARWGAEWLGDAWIAPAIDLGWWPGMGPSSEAEATFRGLTADWEAFDRIGVGSKVLPHLRQDVVDWRKFRDDWKAGDIDSSDIGGKLNAAVQSANRIRRELQSAKIVDPALTGDRQGLDVTQATNALKAAVPVDSFAKSVPGLAWLTDPTASPQAMQGKILKVGAVVAALGLGVGLLISRVAR